MTKGVGGDRHDAGNTDSQRERRRRDKRKYDTSAFYIRMFMAMIVGCEFDRAMRRSGMQQGVFAELRKQTGYRELE